MTRHEILGPDNSEQLLFGFEDAGERRGLTMDDVELVVKKSVSATGKVKIRRTWKPSDEVRAKHESMLGALYGYGIAMPWAYGGMPGRNLEQNAAVHRDNRYFYQLDIRDAYSSVDITQLRGTVQNVLRGYGARQYQRYQIDEFLADTATIQGIPGLPLGLPASPYLFNLYCRQMDHRIAYALGQYQNKIYDSDFVYTRWLDDLIISSPKPITKMRRRAIRDIVCDVSGFEIAHGKTKHHDRQKGPVTVTGISLYPDGRMAVAPHLIGRVKIKLAEATEELRDGIEFGEKDVARLVGYKSILHCAGDPYSSGTTIIRQLARSFDDLLVELGQQNGQTELPADAVFVEGEPYA